MTRRSWAGCNSCRCNLKNSRTRRFTLFRSTEQPTRRLTVIPSRPGAWGLAARITIKCAVFLPRYPRCKRTKSALLRIRRRRGYLLPLLSSSSFWRRRDCKSLSPLGSTVLEYPAPTRGLHAGSETMASTTPLVAWLIRSLHGVLFGVRLSRAFTAREQRRNVNYRSTRGLCRLRAFGGHRSNRGHRSKRGKWHSGDSMSIFPANLRASDVSTPTRRSELRFEATPEQLCQRLFRRQPLVEDTVGDIHDRQLDPLS